VSGAEVQGEGQQGHRMDTLQRFPPDLVLRKKQKIIFDVRPAGAGTTTTPPISYAIIASRSLRCCTRPGHNRPVRSKRPAKAREMAGQALDRLIDPSAPDEERHARKRRLLKGPKEFRDIRDKRVKPKS
jgi:hypothetical protein